MKYKKIKKSYRLVEVHWIDSFSSDRWRGKDELNEFCQGTYNVVTIGFLSYENKKQIGISQSVAEGEMFGDVLVVPRCCIKKMRRV